MADKRIEYEFDHTRFMADVRQSIADEAGLPLSEKIALRDIEARTGISASSFSRVDNDGAMDMDTFMRTCARCNMTPGNYFKRVIWQKGDG